MRIRQQSCFAVSSPDLSVAELSNRLKVPADQLIVAGSRSPSPKRPIENSWRVTCDTAGLTIGEQVAELVSRLEPARAALKDMASAGCARTTLQIVRYFDDEDGEDEDLTGTVPGLERLSGQHQLLGWNMESRIIGFLADVGAEVDVDEYG